MICASACATPPRKEARDAIFGITCGNDVSERVWQHSAQKDVQWWRAKGCDTFGPLGPAIVTGLDPDKLQLTVRLNGEVVQDQSTADFIFDSATMVSFASRYLTIEQGDIIFTGTPGTTPGDAPRRHRGGGDRRHRRVAQSRGRRRQ